MEKIPIKRKLARYALKCGIPLFFFLIILELVGAGIASGDIIPPERRITWTGNVGVPGGIPNRTTICGTASASAYGNDSTDARSHIQGLIDSCPSGQVVYLPAGTYRISGQLNINKGIVLRGAGPGNTILRYTGSSGYLVSIGSGGVGSGVNITSGYTKGSTTLVLSSASGKDVGDLIWIDQLNDGDLVTNQGLGGTCSWCGRLSGTRSMAQISLITAKSGDTVTIDPPMQFTYSSSLDPEAAEISSVTTNAGVEDLKVFNDPGTSSMNIRMWGAKYSWIKNIESERPHTGGSSSCFHMQMGYGFRNEVRDSYFHGNTQTGSNSYVIQMVYGSSYCLLENNIFDEAKAYIYAGWGSSSMVAGYNYIHGFQNDANYYSGDISGHGAHPKFFLLEGNYGQKFRWDNYWGSSSHNTGFRNYYRATQPPGSQSISSYRFPVDIDKDNLYFNLVGNVLGDPGVSWGFQMNGGSCSSGSQYVYMIGYGGEGCGGSHDPETFSTMLRHGNHDRSTDTTRWCTDSGEPGCQGGDGSHAIPNSLYLTGRPAWWCDELPWPPIGPDLSPMVSDIPAKRRFEGLTCTTSGNPPPPPPPPPGLVPLPPSGISVQ